MSTEPAADYAVIDRQEVGGAGEFEGFAFPGDGVSLILVDLPPGGAVKLHRHAYAELFVVHEGTATYTVGSATVAVRAGQVVIVAPGVPHAFVNTGDTRLRQTDVHLSRRIVTEWLEA
jgi:quercetin dioxygenase-like cupin family protein